MKNPVWPLIAPTNVAVPAVPGNVATVTPTQAVTVPPLRRSTRIKNKKISKISAAFLMMTIICGLFMQTTSQTTQQMLMQENQTYVKEVTNSGLMYLQENDVSLKLGVHNVKMKTNLNAETDRQRIKNFTRSFKDVCDDAMTRFKWIICKQQYHDIEAMANITLNSINNVDIPSKLARTKRSSKPGLLVRMLKYLFLSLTTRTTGRTQEQWVL